MITFEEFNYYIGGGTQGCRLDFARGGGGGGGGARIVYTISFCNGCNNLCHRAMPYQIKYHLFFKLLGKLRNSKL